MTISLICAGHEREEAEAFQRGGPEAVEELRHSRMGSIIGMLSGGLTGAAIGSIVPVVGTGIGFFVGSFFGGLNGALNDKTARDNLRSAANLGPKLVGFFHGK